MERSQKLMLCRILAAAVLLGIAVVLNAFVLPESGILRLIVFIVPYVLIAWDVVWRALRNITQGEVFDENFLMLVATVGALCIGEYPEAVLVILLYQLGELFQSYAVGKSRKSIAELMDIRPDYAMTLRGGETLRLSPDEVEVGETIVISPGERVPIDGIVLSGASTLNTAALTGESLPREVAEGDEVISGCVNQSGLLHVRTTKAFHDSTVSRVLELVEDASGNKAKSEDFITRFARWYTPAVVAGAALLAVLPPLIMGGGWAEWIRRGLIFLVVSCPCALVISVPLSFFGGIGGASRRGILIKGGNYLEALARVGTVVFDKTGTLTKGSFTVTAVHPEKVSERELLSFAASAEHYSTHPIAQSLRTAVRGESTKPDAVEELAGMGVHAVVGAHSVCVGNQKLMEFCGAEWRPCHLHGTTAHVAVDGEYAGHIIIGDSVKDEAAESIKQLHIQGIRKTVMLTGDHAQVAAEVAKKVHIDSFYAELLPQDKVEKLTELLKSKDKGTTLAFVGDGINDAPVLARADVGVAMGALGSDAALEAADVVLMNDELQKLPEAVRIARKTLRIVKQNIVFALAVKLIVLALGAVGIAGMWEAVFADVGVAVISILNAMRTILVKKGD